MFPIVDLHCDLLSYLADSPSRKIEDSLSRASYPQMIKGSVWLQVLAIFTYSKPSALVSGKKQLAIFNDLLQKHPNCYRLWDPSISLEKPSSAIYIIPAFENACGFSEEGKPIQEALDFLHTVLMQYKKILYISLTWDGENRFGGGVGTTVGLKEDGKRVLEWLDGKNIAIDLSHTSDFLADDIFNYIDKKSLLIPVLASHSNARAIAPLERNLSDAIAKEIFSRNGIVGLNFFAPFIGNTYTKIYEHIAHLFSLGGENNLCFGADFFPDFDLSEYLQKKYRARSGFFKELSDSSCYPGLLSLLQKNVTKNQLEGLAHKNFFRFIKTTS